VLSIQAPLVLPRWSDFVNSADGADESLIINKAYPESPKSHKTQKRKNYQEATTHEMIINDQMTPDMDQLAEPLMSSSFVTPFSTTSSSSSRFTKKDGNWIRRLNRYAGKSKKHFTG
jgi:hypothetical protein